MKRFAVSALGVAVLGAVFGAQTSAVKRAQPTTPATRPAAAVAHKAELPAQSPAPAPDLVKQYCTGCHSEKGKAGGLSLVGFDATHADQSAEVAERMIRKLRAG